jgi:hypothetical protein
VHTTYARLSDVNVEVSPTTGGVLVHEREVNRMVARARGLLAVATEQTGAEITGLMAGLICDGCGESVFVTADTRDELEKGLSEVLGGWTFSEQERVDLCPVCSEAAAA